MSRVTRFAARDPGPAARVTGFIAHLRAHGLNLGVGETQTALEALNAVRAADIAEARSALRAVCTGCHEDATRFDALFDSYWLADGRVRQRVAPSDRPVPKHSRSTRQEDGGVQNTSGRAHAPGGTGDGEAEGQTGRLVASDLRNLMKTDLRELVDASDIRRAEAVARRLGRALRDRRSRRQRAATRGPRINLRRTIRASLASGGEPLHLVRQRRPERPVKIAALCDVSGSMQLYARVFLAFLAGLMRADPASDAYLFHTRLVRITEALRDDDPLRALNRITLLADGFGGGSRIGGNLQRFAQTYARRFVDGRTVVVILSDGYDSDPPEVLERALARLRKRGCRIIWLNPLKGWASYAPVARGMAAALPHLDVFAAASTLEDLAALEPQFRRL